LFTLLEVLFHLDNTFNVFADAAIDGRIDLDLPAAYQQLVGINDSLIKAYDLACRPGFQPSLVNDAACRFTPLGDCQPLQVLYSV